ncbi:MAG TPA: sensor histidine kinase [Solirubrobacteraceae bacterium]|nr:sensor histidine kinase [Solirubrobacteraceae bacterium]
MFELLTVTVLDRLSAWTERVVMPRAFPGMRNAVRAAQRRAVAAADAERERIARDLHDGAQQRLVAIRLELGLLSETVEQDPGGARVQLESLRAELDDALDELRELAHGLRPPLLASDGLEVALTAAVRGAMIPVTVEIDDLPRLDSPVENAAYFCCLEAVQNVVKHAGEGACAAVSLTIRDDVLHLRITDDGVGFDARRVAVGRGLTNFRERLHALGGGTRVSSAPGRGTRLSGWIPLPASDASPAPVVDRRSLIVV